MRSSRGLVRIVGVVSMAIGSLITACGGSSPSSPGGTGSGSGTGQPGTGTTPRPRVLVVTYTAAFRHTSIPLAETTLAALGTENALYDTEFCRTADDVARLLVRSQLDRFDAVVFANTSGELGIPNLDAFLSWISGGKSFLGIHSASDTYHGAPRYLDMLGAEFEIHGEQADAELVVDSPSHLAVAHITPRSKVFDEIYKFTRNNRADVTMLLSLDRNPLDGLPGAGQRADLPMAWVKGYGSGRVFYTALGHREDIWQADWYRRHLLGAMQWALLR